MFYATTDAWGWGTRPHHVVEGPIGDDGYMLAGSWTYCGRDSRGWKTLTKNQTTKTRGLCRPCDQEAKRRRG